MKLLHLSDLHLGLRLYDYSLLEDQEYILKKILALVDKEKPDGVIIAGDIYDSSYPPVEAVRVFDDFLVSLASRKQQVYIISGNHDSAIRISCGARLMDMSGVHIAGAYDGRVRPVTFEDEFGPVNFWLLPFVKPAAVRQAFPEAPIESWTDAIKAAVDGMGIDATKRNVLVAHQFVTGSTRTESEQITVGGADNVDVSVFDAFDYVALGHLHSPQNCGSERVRYCGTPLKYSFSEARDKKSVTVVELGEKGTLCVRTVPLEPRHDLVELRGTYNELTLQTFYKDTTWQTDYVRITLTDEDDVFDAMRKLRAIYKNLMNLCYDNIRTRSTAMIGSAEDIKSKTPVELFDELFEKQMGRPMTEEQVEYIQKILEDLQEDGR